MARNIVKAAGSYFGGVYKEGKKVRWAEAEVVVKNTLLVLGYIAFMSVVFYVANLCIVKMFDLFGINM
jgi:preprotein translocase SecE subunit